MELSESAGKVRITDLAKRLGIAKASATQAMGSLANLKLIRQERYGPIELTRLGREYAVNIRKRHRTIRKFLVDVLGVPSRVADKDACLMEHVISPVTMNRLVEFLETRVKTDEYALLGSERSEESDEQVKSNSVRTLNQLSPGMKGRVMRVTAKGSLRRRLLDMGITSGVEVVVDGVAPLGDPIDINVRGYHLSLRKSEAAEVYVEVE